MQQTTEKFQNIFFLIILNNLLHTQILVQSMDELHKV